MPKVFISHSWNDNDVSRTLAEYLKRDGADVWIDYIGIKGGDSLPRRISEALEWCDTLVLVWSKSAKDSDWVNLEWENAVALKKNIIPCLIDHVSLPGILSRCLYHDFKDINVGYRALARTLNLTIRQSDGVPEQRKPASPKTATEPNKPTPLPLPKAMTKTKKPVTLPRFRSTPQELSGADVGALLKKYDFYCREDDWSKAWCNPKGKGVKHEFESRQNGQVILNHAIGLMWQQGGSSNYMNYEDAKKYIADLNRDNFAGYSDWRLPTMEEAMCLMEPMENKAGVYIDPVFNKTGMWIWTSDPVKGEPWAWVVIFSTVIATSPTSTATTMCVRFVPDNHLAMDNLMI